MASSLWAGLRGLTTVLLALAVTAIGVRTYLQSNPIPLLGAAAGPPIVVYIQPGTGVQDIAQQLKGEGVIRSRRAFLALAYLKGSIRRLHAGEYEFTRNMSLFDVLSKLESGRVVTHQVSVPEGFTVQEIARLLAGERLVEANAFVTLAGDPQVASRLGVPADGLEGYLYPDTYRLTRGMGEEEILRVMVTRLRQKLPADFAERSARLGLDVHGAITLASLIEKEVRQDRERAIVAAVFHNRLRRQMPLQSDPTAVYGLPDFRGRIRPEDLKRPSPYNTYLNPGLPPGPIANPGLGSLQAAVNPAPVNYLYFVAKNDGTHFFSHTLEEHSDAIRRYQVRGEGSTESGS
jgi:UPF0755 protein